MAWDWSTLTGPATAFGSGFMGGFAMYGSLLDQSARIGFALGMRRPSPQVAQRFLRRKHQQLMSQIMDSYNATSGWNRGGFAAGIGAGVATPFLAGAAIYSGLANLWRGNYGRALLYLAAGGGLAGAMYYGTYMYNRPQPPEGFVDATGI